MSIRFRAGSFGFLLLTTLGCGGDGRPSLVQVTGTVTVDGQPVDGAIVSFQPITKEKAAYRRPSAGFTDASGKFTLGTYDKTDGAPPGKYKVAIQKRELVGQLPPGYNDEKPDAFVVKYKWVTPRKYADPASSGLEAEVTNSELKPSSFDLKTNGEKPEIETTGPKRRGNEP